MKINKDCLPLIFPVVISVRTASSGTRRLSGRLSTKHCLDQEGRKRNSASKLEISRDPARTPVRGV